MAHARLRRLFCVVVGAGCAIGIAGSRSAKAAESLADLLELPGLRLGDAASREEVVHQMQGIETRRRTAAQAKAEAMGLSLRTSTPNGRIDELVDFIGDKPVYVTTSNANAAISTGANLVRNAPHFLSGSGVVIGVWDGGAVRATHQEFGARVNVVDSVAAVDHATHVAGTLIATGVVAAARGMANGATVDSYDWNYDTSEMTNRAATAPNQTGKIYLSNHSYGYINGWNYVNNGTRVWEWYGSGTTATSIETDFGMYNSYARDSDSLAYNAPYYLIFRSAGNERTDNPGSGQTVALSPGSPTVVSYDPAVHPAGDGTYRGGFETIGHNAVAKNVITIGSVTDAVSGGLRAVSVSSASGFSSWGPTDDGRIKPDAVANGEGLYSSLAGSDTSYGSYSGTSMATPNACGSAALLVQQYGTLFPGGAMRSSTLKGLLLHCADDMGRPGPDYRFGWGLINVKAAADLLLDHAGYPEKKRVTEDQLSTAVPSRTVSFVWDGVTAIVATLCWTDPAGAATTTSDLRTPRLVNNLNLKVIAPNGSEYLPYVMPFVGTWTQAAMDLAATTGVNNTDNVEQVRIAAPPAAGTYQVVVNHAGTLSGSQNFALILNGSSATPPPPPPLVLTAVSPSSALPGVTTLDLTGTGLGLDTSVKLTRSGQPDIVAYDPQMIGETLRVQVNLSAAVAGIWNVTASNPNGETSTLTGGFTVIGAVWAENFDGTVSGWTSADTSGTLSWALTNTSSHSAPNSYQVVGAAVKTTTSLTSPAIAIPSGASNLQLKFWHSYNLETAKDGGRLELSVDGGSWVDVTDGTSGAAFASNGYTTLMSTKGKTSDFAGLMAWSGATSGFVETVVNLTNTAKFAGHALRLRWRMAANSTVASEGWHVDSLALLGGGDLSNLPPVITTAATTSATETVTEGETVYQVVRGVSTVLTVGATDDAGEASLVYTWQVTSGPGSPVFFSQNDNNAAKTTTASFDATGDYRLEVAVRDAQGSVATSSVDVRVAQTSSGVMVTPAAAVVTVGGTQQFAASLLDQFGVPMATQPSFTWTTSGGGSITSAGLFSAATAGVGYVVTATGGGFSGTADVTVNRAPATVTLGGLSRIYQGTGLAASVTTTPSGLAVAVTYDGGAALPVNAGSYAVEAVIVDPNYQGSASGTMVISKATATVMLGGLSGTYDGTPKPVTVTTTPAGLTAVVTYNGSTTVPVNAGSYNVVATVDDVNYQGSATGTLVIGKATASVQLALLYQMYDGLPKAVTVSTSPAGLATTVTYDGGAALPSGAGSYAVVATVNDANHQGTATGTLVIAKAPATIQLSGLSHPYDGTAKTATATTIPAGLAVSITYNGVATPPVEPGSYVVEATIVEANYEGSASGTMVIGKQTATIQFAGLEQTYDGQPKAVTVTTTPPGLGVTITYNGVPDVPVLAGSYAVEAVINDPNYEGYGSTALFIAKADAVIQVAGLDATYDGELKPVVVTTVPEGLFVEVMYNGSADVPVNAGTYEVLATVLDGNYQGSATHAMVVAKATATVELAGLSHVYDGTAKTAGVTTVPAGLTVHVTYDGVSSAPADAGSYTVLASVDDANYAGTASAPLVIAKAAATVDLSIPPGGAYDGAARNAVATTVPAGLQVDITYNGSTSAPVNAGSYAVLGTIDDINYEGSASGTLVIAKAAATVVLTNLEQTYDGTAKTAGVSTTPAGLLVVVTYDGGSEPPVNAGSYAVGAVVDDINYQGGAGGTMVIGKAAATVVLTDLEQTYDGTAKTAGVSTTPAGLNVVVTYDGVMEPPVDAGSYVVLATVVEANYQGSASATLVIAEASGWTAWQSTEFTADEIAAGTADDQGDPDHDGWPNLAEYALAMDPHAPNPPLAPVLDLTGLSVGFTRPANLPDVTYAAESSDDLVNWSAVPLQVVTPGATESVRATDPLDGQPPRKFIRLKFGRP